MVFEIKGYVVQPSVNVSDVLNIHSANVEVIRKTQSAELYSALD